MTALIGKHFVCDFLLQHRYQWQNKGKYGHGGGLLHAAIHAVGTFVVMVWVSLEMGIWTALVDGLIHYHIDWLKAQLGARLNLTYSCRLYWILFGLDQMLHYLTYIGFLMWAAGVF